MEQNKKIAEPDNTAVRVALWRALHYYIPAAITSATYYRVVVTSNGASANSSSCTVNVNPQMIGGIISPGYITITSRTSPGDITGTPASGGNCGGSYIYQWQSSTDGINFTAVSGAVSQNYTPGNLSSAIWYRRQVSCSGDIEYSNTCQVVISSGTPDMNYIRIRSILKPAVVDIMYDNFGRQSTGYLPYTASTNDGGLILFCF